MKIWLKPNNSLLFRQVDGLATRLRDAGHTVEVESPIEERSHPGGAAGFVLGVVVSTVFAQEVYPPLRQQVLAWFTEQTRKVPTKVRIYDQDANLRVEFDLPE